MTKAVRHDYIVKVPAFATPTMLKEMNWRSLVIYHIIRSKCRSQKIPGRYVSQSSRSLQIRFGKHYRKYIDDLLKRDWIEENRRYKNAQDGFCKSFRISDENFPRRHKDYAIPLLKSVWEKIVGKWAEDRSELDSEYLRLIKERHDTLVMNSKPRSIHGKRLKVKLDRKIVNVKAKKRAFTTMILSKKDRRTGVIFGNRGKLVNVDVSGMIQQILNRRIRDKRWNQWIKEDFVMRLKKELGLDQSRNVLKKLFIRAVSKKPTSSDTVEKIRKFLRKEFPNIMEYVDQLHDMGTIQGGTQQIEGDLIRSFIMQNKFLQVIPAHDGVFCGENDALIVQAALEDFLQGKGMIGCTKITPEELNQRPLTIMDALNQIP